MWCPMGAAFVYGLAAISGSTKSSNPSTSRNEMKHMTVYSHYLNLNLRSNVQEGLGT